MPGTGWEKAGRRWQRIKGRVAGGANAMQRPEKKHWAGHGREERGCHVLSPTGLGASTTNRKTALEVLRQLPMARFSFI